MVSRTYPNGSLWLQENGRYVEVVEHLDNANFLVKFENSPVFKSQSKEIRGGKVKDRMIPSVCGVGLMGWGDFPAKVGKSNTPAYEVWRGVIRRCYDENWEQYYSYGGAGVTVSDSWKNFQNFAAWYYTEKSKFPETYTTKFDLDKDLKGGREYSEENCTLVPYKLNNFIQVQDSISGDAGYIKPKHKSITTTISLLGRQIYLKSFKTQEEANIYYNIAKRYVTKIVAEAYLKIGLITKETYNLLIQRYGKVSDSEVTKLLALNSTLKSRIHGIVENPENLLSRTKGKLDRDIYKQKDIT